METKYIIKYIDCSTNQEHEIIKDTLEKAIKAHKELNEAGFIVAYPEAKEV